MSQASATREVGSDVPGRSWSGAVAEGARKLGLLGMPLILLFVLLPIGRQDVMGHPVFRVGYSLLLVQLLVTGVALALRSRSRALLHALFGLALVSTALMVPFRPEIHPNDLWAPGMTLVPVLALAFTMLELREYRRVLLPVGLAVFAVELVGPLFFFDLTRLLLADEVFLWQAPAALVIFASCLRAMAERHDEAQRHATDAWLSSMTQQAETHARREAARMLHDHVLHALHAVAEDRSLVTRCQAVVECGATLERLRQSGATGDTASLAELLRQDEALERVGARLVGTDEPLPVAVADGMARATHEAVVNVERHAMASCCEVRLESFGSQGVQVTVTDDGRGFDPSRRQRGRLGLQRSVVERLDDIGGRARIDSAPGRGTRVQLTWPSPEEPDTTPVLAGNADRQSRRAMVLPTVPGVVMTVAMMVLLGPLLPNPAPAVVTTLLALGIAGVIAVRAPEHGISGTDALALGCSAIVAWVANLMAVPHGFSVYGLWMAWGGTAMVQLTLAGLPRRAAARFGAGLMVAQAVGVVWRFGPAEAWHTYSGAVVAGAVIVVVTYQAVFQIQDMARQVDAQQQTAERIHRAVVRMHRAARLDQFWGERVTSAVLPFIESVADGSLDPNQDEVRARARRMEWAVRDELVLGPGPHALGDRLSHLRGLGWQVQSSLSRDDAPTLLATAERLAGVLGSPASPGQVLTLSAGAGGVAAVVLDASPDQLQQWHQRVPELGGTMQHDPDFVRLGMVAP